MADPSHGGSMVTVCIDREEGWGVRVCESIACFCCLTVNFLQAFAGEVPIQSGFEVSLHGLHICMQIMRVLYSYLSLQWSFGFKTMLISTNLSGLCVQEY